MSRPAALLFITMLAASSGAVRAAETDFLPPPGGGVVEAAPDSTESYRLGATPEPGGDIEVVGNSGLAGLGARRPGVRRVGTGWTGHRSALAAGVLPASLTEVDLNGRRADDWIGGGLDLLSVTRPGPFADAAPSGHDLSVWPVYTSVWPRFQLDSGERAAMLVVDVRPGRVPYAEPYARLDMIGGQFDTKVLATEFGRWYFGTLLGPAAFIENEAGSAPEQGFDYTIDRAGGAVSVPLGSEWMARVGGIRTRLVRDEPYWGLPGRGVEREKIRADVDVSVSGPKHRVQAFHTQTWVESESAEGAVHCDRDGFVFATTALPALSFARLELSRSEATGALVGGTHTAVGAGGEAGTSFIWGGRGVSLTAGVRVLDGQTALSGGAVIDASSGPIHWTADARYWERHPTVTERFLTPVLARSYDGEALLAHGNDGLDVEGAASLGGSLAWPGVLSGVGVKGSVALVSSPIIVGSGRDGALVPVNASDEVGGSLTLWAAAGDKSGVSGDATVDLFAFDTSGALNALAPLPVVKARASIHVPVLFFEDFLATRWGLALEHESGLARGPWKDLIDGSRTSVTLEVAGGAESVRAFARLSNIFASDGARIPGAEPGERVLSAGFSWSFVD